MASNYLDKTGLALVWAKIKLLLADKVDKETGKGLSSNDYTSEEKAKLANIATGAEVNVNADWNAVSGDAQILNKPTIPSATSQLTNDSGFITSSDVPEGAAASTTTPLMDGTATVGTETTFARGDHVHPSDTTKVDKVNGKGLSTNDFTDELQTKLNGIATGAEVNQNAFSNILVGGTTVAADGKTDTLELIAGSNVTLTPDASGDTITIAATDTTYSDATTSTSGLMSAADKTKLNSVASGAEANQNAFSNVLVGGTTVAADGKTDTIEFIAGSNVTLTPDATNDTVTIAATDTTYSDATTSASGLMSASDKTKLNGVASGAEVNQNAFSNVKVGSVTVAADAKTDTLELVAGTNITLTPDATDDKVTITNSYSLPTASASTLGGVKVGANLSITDGVLSADAQAVDEATTTTAGLMSASDKTKLNGIETGADANIIEAITVNSSATTVTNKTVNITVPTNNNQLTNGAGYQTASDVSTAISSAIGDLEGVDFQVVQNLPVTGDKGVIYLVADTHSDQNDLYDEYIWLTSSSSYEKIGNTDVDLSDYYNTTNMVAITSNEIDTVCT